MNDHPDVELIYHALLRAERSMEDQAERDPTTTPAQANFARFIFQVIRMEIGRAMARSPIGASPAERSALPREDHKTDFLPPPETGGTSPSRTDIAAAGATRCAATDAHSQSEGEP